MKEWSYTSTHSLGHTGLATGSLHLYLYQYNENSLLEFFLFIQESDKLIGRRIWFAGCWSNIPYVSKPTASSCSLFLHHLWLPAIVLYSLGSWHNAVKWLTYLIVTQILALTFLPTDPIFAGSSAVFAIHTKLRCVSSLFQSPSPSLHSAVTQIQLLSLFTCSS